MKIWLCQSLFKTCLCLLIFHKIKTVVLVCCGVGTPSPACGVLLSLVATRPGSGLLWAMSFRMFTRAAFCTALGPLISTSFIHVSPSFRGQWISFLKGTCINSRVYQIPPVISENPLPSFVPLILIVM